MQNSVKNNVHRSGFDLSMRNMFTSKTGEIVPCGVFEIIPGDSAEINLSHFMRTVPVQTASFGRLRHYIDAYFVPLRLLWDKFPAWVVQTNNQYFAKSSIAAADPFTSQPYFTSDYVKSVIAAFLSGGTFDSAGLEARQTSAKLLQYLGYGDFSTPTSYEGSNTPLNVFPLLAYQKIYQDYFRFSQWEDAAPWTYNLDYILSSSQLNINTAPTQLRNYDNMFKMRYCNYDKDLFHGFLPSAQFGDEAVAGPLTGVLAGDFSHVLVPTPGSSLPNEVERTIGFTGNNPTFVQEGYKGSSSLNTPVRARSSAEFSLNDRHEDASGMWSNNSGISVLLLRQAEALQKWKEITLSGTADYKEQLAKHWNVQVSDESSDRCRYLGGIAENVDVSEVVNQNLEPTDSRADIAGMGKQASGGHIKFTNYTQDYGILMIVSHVKPIAEWSNTVVTHPLMFKHLATDYAIPEFDNLGMQSIPFQLFRLNRAGEAALDPAAPVGFAPRYFDYKTNYDRVCGEFLKTYKPWVLPVPPIPSNFPKAFNYTYFKVSPHITDDMFLLQATGSTESDLYKHSLYIDVKITRNLSYDGMPY